MNHNVMSDSGAIWRLNTVFDLNASDLLGIIDGAEKLDRSIRSGIPIAPYLRGKYLAMLFDETTLRTRSAFERAMLDLGGHALHYTAADVRIGRHAKKKEHAADVVNVMGGFNDAILSRIYDQGVQAEIAAFSPVPFINGMCDRHHPTQALCDLLTIKRHFGRLEGLKIAFVGDATNVARSLAQASTLVGAHFWTATPQELAFPAAETAEFKRFTATTNAIEAVENANVVVTDVWFPMNTTADERRRRILEPYRVTSALMERARPDAIFMHNLSANRGDEVEPAVIDGGRSVVYEEAIARLHIARSLMLACLQSDWRSRLAELPDC